MAAVVIRRFLATHSGIITVFRKFVTIKRTAAGAAVVGHKNQDGIVRQPFLVQKGIQASEIFVDIRNHAVEGRFGNLRIIPVQGFVFFRHQIG